MSPESADSVWRPAISEARCANCGYSLRGLREPRCPECGRIFDPNDPATFAVGEGRRAPMLVPIMGYVLALGIAGAFWAWFVYSRGPQFGIHGVLPVLYATLLSGCGPLLLIADTVMPLAGLGGIVLLFVASWAAWIGVLWKTGLYRLPWCVHLFAGLLWCFCGAAIASVGA